MSELERLREEYRTLTEDSEDMFIAKDFVDRLIAALEAEVERADAEIKRLNDICDRLAAAGRSHD